MTLDENIKFVLQHSLEKILNGKLNRDFFLELEKLNEYLDDIKQKEFLTYLPTFNILSGREIKRMVRFLSKSLIDILYERELSFLQTMRILKALYIIEYDIASLKKINPKVEFCIRIMQEYIYEDLELINLLDKI